MSMRAYLRRERIHDGGRDADGYLCQVGRNLVDDDGQRIEMGELAPGQAWWEIPLPPCPDCGGQLVWAEAGYVPGTRQCTACGSLFSVKTEAVKTVKPCVACDRATSESDYHYDGLALCLACFEKVARGGRLPRQTIQAVIIHRNDPDVGGPDDPLDHEDYRDLERLGLWPEEEGE